MKSNGRSFSFWLGSDPFIALFEATDMEAFLSCGNNLNKAKQYDAFHWILGNGLLTSEAELYKKDRKLIGRSFNVQKHEGFLNCFNKHSKIVLNVIKDNFESRDPDMKSYDVFPTVFRFTTDTISEYVLGRSLNTLTNSDDRILNTIHIAMDVLVTKVLNPFTKLPIIKHITGVAAKEAAVHKLVDEIFDQEVLHRRALIQQQKHCNEEIEDTTLLDVGLGIKSDTELKEHGVTIFGGGLDSTSTAISLTLYLFALHPEWQKRVQDELDLIYGQNSFYRDATLKDLGDIKCLEMCIKESLRVYTPAPVIMREASEDILLENSRVIPKGCSVMLFLHHLHRDENVFPDPEMFNPNRFDPANSKKFTPYEYMPFSTGQRNCIGGRYAMIQMKTCISHILRNYSISTDMKRDELKLRLGLFIDVPGGIHLCFKRRHVDHVLHV